MTISSMSSDNLVTGIAAEESKEVPVFPESRKMKPFLGFEAWLALNQEAAEKNPVLVKRLPIGDEYKILDTGTVISEIEAEKTIAERTTEKEYKILDTGTVISEIKMKETIEERTTYVFVESRKEIEEETEAKSVVSE
ncbi:MAG: hypothetical protein ACOYK9_03650 [Chlamydiia bacterium]